MLMAGRPGPEVSVTPPPPSGMPLEIIDAWMTPGMALIRSTMSAKAGAESGGWVLDSTRGAICAVNTFSGLKPGSIRSNDKKLPMKSAAPTRRTTARATSMTTSPLRIRLRRAPALARADSFKALERSGVES